MNSAAASPAPSSVPYSNTYATKEQFDEANKKYKPPTDPLPHPNPAFARDTIADVIRRVWGQPNPREYQIEALFDRTTRLILWID